MSKPSAAIASDMPTAGGVGKSSEKIPSEQGRTKHKLDCRMMYAGDSVGHGALSPKEEEDNLRLKGGGNKKTQDLKIKTFISKSEFLNEALTVLRSSSLFHSFKDHKKCPVKSSCNFCLLRSAILKANLKSGRPAVTPVEMECQDLKQNSVEMMLAAIFVNATRSMEEFSAALYQEWNCSCCKSYLNGEDYLILIKILGSRTLAIYFKENMKLS